MPLQQKKSDSATPVTRCMAKLEIAHGADGSPKTAHGSIASMYGRNLLHGSPDFITGDGKNPPLELGSFSVTVSDLPARIFMFSDSQINFYIPNTLSSGRHLVQIFRNNQPYATAEAEVAEVAPGLFVHGSQNSALGYATISSRETSEVISLVNADGYPNSIPVGFNDRATVVTLIGTGFRSTQFAEYEITLDELQPEIIEIAPPEDFPLLGLDNLKFKIPSELSARGQVALKVRHLPTQTETKSATINIGPSLE